MEDKLTKEEVLHVAELARIAVTEEEIEKYQVELKKLLNDVEKVNDVKGYDDEILIAPWSNNTDLREDTAYLIYLVQKHRDKITQVEEDYKYRYEDIFEMEPVSVEEQNFDSYRFFLRPFDPL